MPARPAADFRRFAGLAANREAHSCAGPELAHAVCRNGDMIVAIVAAETIVAAEAK
jgi:hypothetical protein